MTAATARDLDMLNRIRRGEMLREVGDTYGLTRERVRQIVTALDPTATKVGMAVRLERRRIVREIDRAKQVAANPTCFVCWGPITNRVIRKHHRRSVCGTRCYDLLSLTRWHLDEQERESRKRAVARWMLAHPEKCTAYQLRHAEREVAGTSGRYTNCPRPLSLAVKVALDEVARLRAANCQQPEDVAS